MRNVFTSLAYLAAAALAGVVLCAGPLPQIGRGGGGAGPVAIAIGDGREALVLMADGRVATIDTASGAIGRDIYRVPDSVTPIDLAAGRTKDGTILCLTVNPKSGNRPSSLLQVFGDGRSVSTPLLARGVYVGVAVDAGGGVAYVANSSNNVVYRLRLGEEKGIAGEVATLAGRIGTIALDEAGKRLFVSDWAVSRLHIVSLLGWPPKSIPLAGISDVRALAWSPADNRLYVADSGREAVWSVDPATASVQPAFKDARFRAPSGLAFAGDGTLWMVDEAARGAFQLSIGDRRVLRALRWGRQ